MSAAKGPSLPTQKYGEDAWEEIAKSYLKVANSPTGPPSKAILEEANKIRPFSTATSILDNGCGPGPIIGAILGAFGKEIPQQAKLHAADNSPAMIKQTESMKAEKVAAGEAIWDRLQVSVKDAHTLEGIDDKSVSHVTGGFLYMLVPEPRKALAATHRVLDDDGVLVLTCWKRSNWMDAMLQINEIRPGQNSMGLPSEWMSLDGVRGELQQAGFRDIGAREVETTMAFQEHGAQADFFLRTMPPLISGTADFTAEEKTRLRSLMIDTLKRATPEAPGELHGTAIVAWARR